MNDALLSYERSRSNGAVGEFIDLLKANWLDDTGIGFNQLVSIGFGSFGFDGENKKTFLRLCIRELFAKEGRPVVVAKSEHGLWWQEVFHYGSKPEEIADAMITEWVAEGAPQQAEWGRWWFAYPNTWC